jgi:hypothetical protein
MLPLLDGLCGVGLVNTIGVVAGVRRQISSIYWAQLSGFHLKTETESNLRNAML